jgi:hypothetical protein
MPARPEADQGRRWYIIGTLTAYTQGVGAPTTLSGTAACNMHLSRYFQAATSPTHAEQQLQRRRPCKFQDASPPIADPRAPRAGRRRGASHCIEHSASVVAAPQPIHHGGNKKAQAAAAAAAGTCLHRQQHEPREMNKKQILKVESHRVPDRGVQPLGPLSTRLSHARRGWPLLTWPVIDGDGDQGFCFRAGLDVAGGASPREDLNFSPCPEQSTAARSGPCSCRAPPSNHPHPGAASRHLASPTEHHPTPERTPGLDSL